MFKYFLLLILIPLSVLIAPETSYASATGNSAIFPSLAPIVKQATPAIVNIATQGELPPLAIPDEHGGFRKISPHKFTSLGSGVILDAKKGYIVTNHHVINDALMITVTLNNSRRLKAKLIGSDPTSDIAILQIKAEDLQALPLGDSSLVQAGDFVLAIGNPFGINMSGTQPSATFGIVSGIERSDLHIEGIENFIQTDAAINPGNSGGALINTKGELIGINTAIIAPLQVNANIGIGLAIPINMVREITNQLIQYGSVHRGLMGIFVQDLTPDLAEALNLPHTKGAIVSQVNQGSPAQKAGFQAGDILQKINQHPIENATQVKNIIHLLRVGNKVTIDLLRNGKLIHINTTVVDPKQHEDQQQAQNPFLFGLALENFAQELPLQGMVKGVRIVGASENSLGWRAGLRPGDVIMDANQQTVSNMESLNQIAHSAKETLLLHVTRGQSAIYVVLK